MTSNVNTGVAVTSPEKQRHVLNWCHPELLAAQTYGSLQPTSSTYGFRQATTSDSGTEMTGCDSMHITGTCSDPELDIDCSLCLARVLPVPKAALCLSGPGVCQCRSPHKFLRPTQKPGMEARVAWASILPGRSAGNASQGLIAQVSFPPL